MASVKLHCSSFRFDLTTSSSIFVSLKTLQALRSQFNDLTAVGALV